MSARRNSLNPEERETTLKKEPDNVELKLGENFYITFRRKKPFTKKQIENIEKYFGFKVRNL